ncbi:hypothetical protein CEUSTIGMA_g1971.t1 [Chlamydomonas eustigma]|uniref:Uncharacterized protein n=1 Tax=Chlamydomonas eustigma TaxID=1157962 RepID=A0A250WV78_9CHLO|nr:hypothetical protein CEUSTIGMA_g1971.t1 [Chlamydomonas eustigma]|eukprot:GAX74522.1 hypothetical protein CEUSTIGMA_g1971.t1 [Chlamydomonas eustigma]
MAWPDMSSLPSWEVPVQSPEGRGSGDGGMAPLFLSQRPETSHAPGRSSGVRGLNQGRAGDEFAFPALATVADEDDEYSDDYNEKLFEDPDGDEEDSGDNDGPTLFIDSGNNADSPARHGNKAVIIAAAGGGDSGDESMLGNSADLEMLGASGSQQPQGSQFKRRSLASRGGGRSSDVGSLSKVSGEASQLSTAEVGGLEEEDVVEKEGPVMADEELLAMPSLDIIGDGTAVLSGNMSGEEGEENYGEDDDDYDPTATKSETLAFDGQDEDDVGGDSARNADVMAFDGVDEGGQGGDIAREADVMAFDGEDEDDLGSGSAREADVMAFDGQDEGGQGGDSSREADVTAVGEEGYGEEGEEIEEREAAYDEDLGPVAVNHDAVAEEAVVEGGGMTLPAYGVEDEQGNSEENKPDFTAARQSPMSEGQDKTADYEVEVEEDVEEGVLKLEAADEEERLDSKDEHLVEEKKLDSKDEHLVEVAESDRVGVSTLEEESQINQQDQQPNAEVDHSHDDDDVYSEVEDDNAESNGGDDPAAGTLPPGVVGNSNHLDQ